MRLATLQGIPSPQREADSGTPREHTLRLRQPEHRTTSPYLPHQAPRECRIPRASPHDLGLQAAPLDPRAARQLEPGTSFPSPHRSPPREARPPAHRVAASSGWRKVRGSCAEARQLGRFCWRSFDWTARFLPGGAEAKTLRCSHHNSPSSTIGPFAASNRVVRQVREHRRACRSTVLAAFLIPVSK